MKRRHQSAKQHNSRFNKAAKHTRKINTAGPIMRGGIRL